jgi:4-diphosphocytidyl-2-C-methyl-D-erythritol kinase
MDARRARVRCLAKVNLSLRVLHKRPDDYHELRTVFQTVSLADVLDVEFTPARTSRIELASDMELPADSNLVTRAGHVFLETMKVRGRVRFHLIKRIPMGAGLGGGSSDAAAALLTLNALTGRGSLEQLSEIAAQLGSDVPFFLYGGAALGIGRGTELYPLPDVPELPALIVAPPVHVSTAEAYRALGRSLTPAAPSSIMSSLQTFAWQMALTPGSFGESENDFERAVFRQHPRLAEIKRKLLKQGARPALMSGSGSAVFGVFGTTGVRDRAEKVFSEVQCFPVKFVSRRSYRRMWLRQLGEHVIDNKTWPPPSRYAK